MPKLIQLVHNQDGEITYALDDEGQLYSYDSVPLGFGASEFKFVPVANNIECYSNPAKALSNILSDKGAIRRPITDSNAKAIMGRLQDYWRNSKKHTVSFTDPANDVLHVTDGVAEVVIQVLGNEITFQCQTKTIRRRLIHHVDYCQVMEVLSE